MAATEAISKAVPDTQPHVPVWLIMVTIMLGAIMAIIDSSIVNVALPTISGNLGASTDEISSISTVYILANVIIMPLNGYLTSLMGRKWYYAVSLIVFTTTSFLCGIAWSLNALVFFRILQGLGGGALMPTAQAILFETFPKEKHGQAMAFFGLAAMVGPAIGPTLGGWLVDSYGWRIIFNINIVPGIIATILTILFIRNPSYLQKVKGRLDFLGLASMVIGLSSLQYVLEKGQENDWFESNFILFLAITAVVCITFFIIWELKIKNPIVDLRVFNDRNFTAGNILGIITGFGLFGLNLILPLFLSSILGFNSFQTGMAILPGALATAAGMPIVGSLADRVDPRFLTGPGIAVYAISGYMMSTLTTQSGYWDFFWPRIIQGLSLAFLFVPLSKVTMGRVPLSKMSGASGLYSLLRQLGGSVGIAILTTLLTYYTRQEYSHLADYVNTGNPLAMDRFHMLQGFMMSKGVSGQHASQQALLMLKGATQRQALMLAYNNLFLLTSAIFLSSLPLLLMLKPKKAATQQSGPEIHMAME
jgi:DHA2 family multidrug resistance protein